MRDARRRLIEVMDGVGQGKTIFATTKREIALHARRSLSDAEIASLDPVWCAIPAQDEFSEDGLVEMEL